MATTKRRQRRADVRTLVDAGFNVAWASDGDKPQGVASIPWTHPDYLPALMSRAAVTLCVDLWATWWIANKSLPCVQRVSRVFTRSELECVAFLHRVTRYEIDAVDDTLTCDLLNSGHRFGDSLVLRGEQVTLFESHRFSNLTLRDLFPHPSSIADETDGTEFLPDAQEITAAPSCECRT